MLSVAKRDRETMESQLGKIAMAIKKAFRATGKPYTADIIELSSPRVASDFQEKIKDSRISVEDIQDNVEEVLKEFEYTDVAKAYILYREQGEKIRNLDRVILNYKDAVDNYAKVEDWRVKENSTITYSVDGLIPNNSGVMTANCWLTKVYGRGISDAHVNGDIHIHDLSMLTSYSCGWSPRRPLLGGLGGTTGGTTASPARYPATLRSQVVNFLGIMQNKWAASQSFSSFDTYLTPFVKAGNLSYDKVKKYMKTFVFGVSIPSRRGTRAPLSHIFMDLKVSGDMTDKKVTVGGRRMEFTYRDCREGMDMVNRALLETILEGDANGPRLQCSILVYGIGPDYDWSGTEQNRLLFPLASHYDIPYFVNRMGNDMKPEDVRTSYGGVRPDFRVLRKKSDDLFGCGEHTDSTGVVIINLPRITYQSKGEEEFLARLDQTMDLAARSLGIKRKVISTLPENRLYPYTACYLTDFDNYFLSIGVTGMNKAGLNTPWLKAGLESEEAGKLAVSVLDRIREKLIGYQIEYGNLYGLEATPTESATSRFARLDREYFSGARTAGCDEDKPHYTNNTKLPTDCDGTLRDTLVNQDSLQPLYTTGTVLHVYMGQELEDRKQARDLLQSMFTEYHTPCFTLSPVYTICQACGYLPDGRETCPKYKGAADVYSRIAGYYRPVHNWNDDRAQGLKNRIVFHLYDNRRDKE